MADRCDALTTVTPSQLWAQAGGGTPEFSADRCPDHLRVIKSDRGFSRLPAIPSTYGGAVEVYESSAATGPHIWLQAAAPVDLNRPDGPMREAPIHLTALNAWRLAEQLMHLVRNHYQGDARAQRSGRSTANDVEGQHR